jgi:hypothetical protein
MTLSTAQKTALAQPAVRVVCFVEFDFAGGVGRFSTFNINVVWNTYTWLGAGEIASISEVSENVGTTSKQINFSLKAVDPVLLALAAGAVEEYRGRSAKMWLCPLDEGYQLIGTPELCWRGIMDLVTVDVGSGVITLKCETSAYGLKRRQGLRMNAQQHKMKYPTDTGLDHVAGLIASPKVWLTKWFQTPIQ